MEKVQLFAVDGLTLVPVQIGINGFPGTGAFRVLPYGLDQDGTEVGSGFITPIASSDQKNAGALHGMFGMAGLYGYNGVQATGYDRIRTASATNTAAALVKRGILATEGSGHWSINHAPVANTTATITKAAVAGTLHVCTSISFNVGAVAAIAPGLQIVLRDSTTGAGNILWSMRGIGALAGTSVSFGIGGLCISGVVAQAMTLEFTAGPGATNFESVSLSGFSVAG